MRRRIEIGLAAAIAVVAICWIVWSIYRSHKIEGLWYNIQNLMDL